MGGIKAALGLAVGMAMLLGGAASAQGNYPNRPIRIIVPYPAGGIVDIVARIVIEQVGRDLKQAIVVEARPGANGNIGTSAVARSEPDGARGWSRDPQRWSTRRSTRTPAGTR